MKYYIDYYYTSNVGKRRSSNQDNYICITEYMNHENDGTNGVISGVVSSEANSLIGVFDGMGGEERGEMAAYIAAKSASKLALSDDPKSNMKSFCKSVNNKICDFVKKNALSSAGTTAATLAFCKKEICLCNIGDSKIFRFRKEKLLQVSEDHVSISAYGTKPPLSQNLGIPENEMTIEPYICSMKYADSDIYLICTDGLTDMVKVSEIEEALKFGPCATVVEKLLKSALKNGGIDNITMVLCVIRKESISDLFKRFIKNLRGE